MNEKKHAYLIIAHANLYVLQRLINLLDDERNDIYIHIDRKVKHFDFRFFQQLAQYSQLTFIERVDVHWGHVSQIEVELKLFRAASQTSHYAYYHLISGADLPIKSQDFIHHFFEKNAGKEFIGFSGDKLNEDKVKKIHLFPKSMRPTQTQLLKRWARKVRTLFIGLQHAIGYSYKQSAGQTFVHGCNWVSVTDALVQDLLAKEGWFLNYYKYASCADEIYKHSFVYNSDYKNAVYNMDNELKGCQRFMDWNRGRPYTFRKEDFELIMASHLLFARKFEDSTDKEIVDAIYHSLKA